MSLLDQFPPGLQAQIEIAQEIFKERREQDAQWGVQDHSNEKWACILGEEVGEVNKAILEDNTWEELRGELIQVAAVAMAWVECGDRRWDK